MNFMSLIEFALSHIELIAGAVAAWALCMTSLLLYHRWKKRKREEREIQARPPHVSISPEYLAGGNDE